MEDHWHLIALASVIVFGAAAQWAAWRIKVPSILLLLAAGFLAGPVLGIVKPDEIFGDFLFTVVSLSVAIILFEGSLSLRASELREIGSVLAWLLTVGMVVTWVLAALGARLILGMAWFPSVLLGAILVVTGPTVIGPILRQVRPIGPVGQIARWEGIVIDPVGAVLAVLTFEAFEATYGGLVNAGLLAVLARLALTVFWGTVIGGAAAWSLAWLLKRHAIPDHLESLVTLQFVIAAFTAANVLQRESGLIAVTLMGVLIANSGASLKHIAEFKESLSLLLISGLFILLAARVDPQSFLQLGVRGLAFVAFMIVVVRPLAVFASTWRSKLRWNEKIFLACLAPRGIVAAAVASVFAIELGTERGVGLAPATFTVIVGTVVIYGLIAGPLARRLGLAVQDPQGILIVGAHEGAQAIGQAVSQAGFPVLLADANPWNIRNARMTGLKTRNVNILQEDVAEELDLGGLGRLLAMTSNDEVNSLAAISFADLFGRANVYQLTPWRRAEQNVVAARHLRSRYLFGKDLTFDRLTQRIRQGDVVKSTKLTKEFDYQAFLKRHGPTAIPLFVASGQRLIIFDAEEKIDPKPGQTLIALTPASAAEPPTEESADNADQQASNS